MRLPTIIEESIGPAPLSNEEITKSLEKLTEVIKFRLLVKNITTPPSGSYTIGKNK
jgi:hypothetical protein